MKKDPSKLYIVGLERFILCYKLGDQGVLPLPPLFF